MTWAATGGMLAAASLGSYMGQLGTLGTIIIAVALLDTTLLIGYRVINLLQQFLAI